MERYKHISLLAEKQDNQRAVVMQRAQWEEGQDTVNGEVSARNTSRAEWFIESVGFLLIG